MMPEKKVSIIIPVYNKDHELPACLESVCSQTFRDLEIVLIDDGSTDGSPAICDHYAEIDPRIVVRHIPNGGVSNARNLGVSIASGQYIQFVDADDQTETDMTEVLYALIKRTEADLAICGYYQVYNDRPPVSVAPPDQDAADTEAYYQLISQYYLDPLCGSPCNRMMRRDLIKEHALQYRMGQTFAEDFLFNLDYLTYARKIAMTSRCLYRYNLDVPGSLFKTTQADLDKRWQQQVVFLTVLRQRVQEHGMADMYPGLASSIAFDRISRNLHDRIAAGVDTKTLKEWLKDTVQSGLLDLNQVEVYVLQPVCPENRRVKEKNAKLKKMLLFCIRHGMGGIYIRMIQFGSLLRKAK